MGNILRDFGNWLLDQLKDLAEWFVGGLLEALAAILAAIPVPDFVNNTAGLFSQIPGEVWFYWSALQIPYGVGVMLTAWALRFLIRRIPFIG